MASSTDIEAAAQKYIESYAAAMHLAHSSPATPIPDIAKALGSHYLPGLVSLTHGHIVSAPHFTDAKASAASIEKHLEKFVNSGVGVDIRLKKSRVETIEGVGGSALCFLTWAIFPTEGWKGEAWHWENCYFYRRKPDGTEGWEGIVSDGEVEGMIKNIPEAFDLGGAS